MIRVQGLAKAFRRGRQAPVPAVVDIGFEAGDAAITGLLGPNGAGKTTTLRMVAALLPPDAGRVTVDGLDSVQQPQAVQARLGVLSDARGLYPRLTARENIVYHAQLQGLDAALANRRLDRLAGLLDMAPLLGRRTEGFSQGERMKTALARALVHDPPNLVLDEPTNGLDVLATRSLRQVLRRLRDDEGKCILVSTHIMQEVERLCDQVVVVAAGRTVAQGTLPELLARTGQADVEACFVQLAYGAPALQEAP